MKSASLMVRREAAAAARSDALVEAAEAVFVARGFAGTSVEDIASRAGVSLATFYKAFASKEALFAEVVGRGMHAFVQVANEAMADGTGAQRLEALVQAAFRYFEEHDGAFRLYLSATGGFPWEYRANLREGAVARYHAFLDAIEGLVRSASPGYSRKEARASAVAFAGALNALLGIWVEEVHRRPAKAVAKEAWTVLRKLAVQQEGAQ